MDRSLARVRMALPIPPLWVMSPIAPGRRDSISSPLTKGSRHVIVGVDHPDTIGPEDPDPRPLNESPSSSCSFLPSAPISAYPALKRMTKGTFFRSHLRQSLQHELAGDPHHGQVNGFGDLHQGGEARHAGNFMVFGVYRKDSAGISVLSQKSEWAGLPSAPGHRMRR